MKLTLQLIAYIVKIQGLGGGRVVKGSRFMPKKIAGRQFDSSCPENLFPLKQAFKK